MSFTDFISLQRDVAHALLCEPWLADVNIVMRHELLTEDALKRLPDRTLAAEVLVYVTPRNKASGRKGCGVIVEVPEFNVQSPNVTGPQGDIFLPLLVLEEPLMNEAPATGTLRPANQVAQKILDLLHLDADDGTGTIGAAGAAITPAKDWEPLRAFNVRLKLTCKRQQTARAGVVTIAVESGLATLACNTAESSIYYTVNGGFPGPSNSSATLYTAPFSVTTGDVLRAGAYAPDLNPSPRRNYTVN